MTTPRKVRPPSAETALLAAIHCWAATRAERPTRGLAGFPRERDDLGSWSEEETGLAPGTTAAVPVPVRQGLRSSSLSSGGAGDDGACWMIRVDPPDGAVCVFRDAPVVGRFSGCLDPASVGADTFRVLDDQGPLAGELRLSPDARVLIWEPCHPLAPNLHHFVMASGLRDARGRGVNAHLSRFLTCDLMRKDLSG